MNGKTKRVKEIKKNKKQKQISHSRAHAWMTHDTRTYTLTEGTLLGLTDIHEHATSTNNVLG